MDPFGNVNNVNYEQINPFANSQNQIPFPNIIINPQQQLPQQQLPQQQMQQMQQIQQIQQIPQQNNQNNSNKRTNKNLLLNRINEAIIIDSHAHPLCCCFTVERAAYSEVWTCRNCGNNYQFDIPSFYCTFCDYDLCQNCLMKIPLGEIKMVNENRNFEVYTNIYHPNYKKNLHRHPLALVKMEKYLYGDEKFITCKRVKGNNNGIYIYCSKVIKLNSDCFYFCSLCNKYICRDCFINNNQNVIPQPSADGISSLNMINKNFICCFYRFFS